MSDRALSRLAWAVFVLVVALFAGAVLMIPFEHTDSSEAFFIASVFAFPLVGGLVASRRPRNTIGWILLAIGFSWGLGELIDSYATWGAPAHPGSLPGAAVLSAISGGLWVPAVGLLGTFAILLFPDGHLPSRGWRFLARTTVAALIAAYAVVLLSPGPLQLGRSARVIKDPLAVAALAPVMRYANALVLVLPVCVLASAWALIRRFRRSEGVERLQLKWLTTAAAIVATTYLVAMLVSIGSDWGSQAPAWVAFIQVVSAMSFCLIAVAIGIAVLRYRLYDIDVVINKTLVYGALAAFITGVYIAIVVGVGALFGRGGRPSVGLSIVATVVVALAFQPVRERVQHLANRLVYGKRATPYEVLSSFSERLSAAYAADELLPRMARTLAEGVGARRADVWLRVDGVLFHEATWPADGPLSGPIPAPGSDVPAIPDSTLTVAVRHQGELLGALSVTKPPAEPLTPVESALLDDLAAQAGLVLRNVRLMAELRTSRQRIVVAQDDERRRLEHDIHDGAQQQLITLSMAATSVRNRLNGTAEKAAEMLDGSLNELRAALEEIRELARGIHPSILTNQGLPAALESLADRSLVPVSVTTNIAGRLPAPVEATAYFAVNEALANVAKYASASAVNVSAERVDGHLTVRVRDDGVGGADPARGSGLRGLLDRVHAVGGRLEIDSPAGHGTTMLVTLPCA
jgi:signal transduction histidine kinase